MRDGNLPGLVPKFRHGLYVWPRLFPFSFLVTRHRCFTQWNQPPPPSPWLPKWSCHSSSRRLKHEKIIRLEPPKTSLSHLDIIFYICAQNGRPSIASFMSRWWWNPRSCFPLSFEKDPLVCWKPKTMWILWYDLRYKHWGVSYFLSRYIFINTA